MTTKKVYQLGKCRELIISESQLLSWKNKLNQPRLLHQTFWFNIIYLWRLLFASAFPDNMQWVGLNHCWILQGKPLLYEHRWFKWYWYQKMNPVTMKIFIWMIKDHTNHYFYICLTSGVDGSKSSLIICNLW